MKKIISFSFILLAILSFSQVAHAAVLDYTPSSAGVNYGYGSALSRINDGNISTIGTNDYQVHPTNAIGKTITMTFDNLVNIVSVEFYNRAGCCGNRIGEAQMIFKDEAGTVVYTYDFVSGNNPALVTITDPVGDILNVKTVELTNFQQNNQNFREIIFNGTEILPTTLRITEVEYDTIQPGNDGSYEWIEIYNYGTADINLENWTITDANPTTVTLPSLNIPAGAQIVLANNPTNFQVNYPSVTADIDLSPTLGLSNAGDTLTLRNPTGDDIDFVAWEGASAGWNLVTDPGESICRVDSDSDTDAPGDFIVCTNPSPQSDDVIAPPQPIAPDLTTDSGNSATDNITNDATPSFDVVCSESTSTLTLFQNGISRGTSMCSAVGLTSITASNIGEGTWDITYSETDQFGNESIASPILIIQIDTRVPNNLEISADTDGAFTVDMPNLEFSATDNGGSGIFSYEISIDGGAFTVQTSPYNPTIPAALSHTVIVRATDFAGNQSTSTVEFPPVVSITSPTTLSNAAISDGTIVITGPNDITSVTLSANTSNLNCGVFPQATPVTCSFQVNSSGTVTATAVDTTAATGFNTRDYVIENNLPIITFDDDVEAGPLQTDTVTVSVADASGIASLGYVLSANPVCDAASYAAGTEILFGSGNQILNQNDESENGNYLCIEATDNAGNTAYQSSANDFNIDVTPPAVVLTVPTSGAPVSGTGEVNAIINVTTPSGAFCNTTVNAGATWSCNLIGTFIDAESIIVTATDAAGNQTVITETNAIDLVAPNPPIVNQPVENPITGTGTAGDTITVTTDSGATCTSSVQPDGAWECMLAPEPVPGENYSATANDPLGNISGPATGTIFLPSSGSRGGSKRISQNRLNDIFGDTQDTFDIQSLIERLAQLQKQYDALITSPNCIINYTRLIKRGMVGEDVRQVQTCLNSLGFASGPEDGIYASLTFKGITSYQRSKNLIFIDGIVGPETSASLNALLGVVVN